MKPSIPRLVIAALRGGAGKTTLSVGVIAALSKRGVRAVPFKKGPDYIDAAWLSFAAGRPCHNLDSFLMDRETIRRSFSRHALEGDLAFVEGNRGLYDGMDVRGSHSTAELAKLLDAPVVMIMDCNKVTRTAAAMILGCSILDPDVDIRGVILNRVAGTRHEDILRRTIEETCRLPVLGAVPRMKDFPFPERHLGLTPPQEHERILHALDRAADVAGRYIDLDGLLAVARRASSGTASVGARTVRHRRDCSVTIGVVRDSAFQFYYPENLAALAERGAKVIEISPLRDDSLPDIDLLYIGGGFPETHAEALTENEGFRASLREAADAGLPVYAECGGLMYLGESLVLGDRTYPMTGALPVSFAMTDKPQGHGYTVLEVVEENPFFRVGSNLKGHEFHHSRILSIDLERIRFAYRVKRGTGVDGLRDGLCRKNILAGYTHLHALGTKEWAVALVERARVCRQGWSDTVHYRKPIDSVQEMHLIPAQE
ncbi:MAG: hydrogenobyrinic acid a,c-diamide synthase (glutamine-hydrolyzing) [Syntrophaceae bacterium]|nr:hydrogenobyrinic acid a,c-diamide synthase (glutamine-hydrolyzing) [Syntrophaceae bacterium]